MIDHDVFVDSNAQAFLTLRATQRPAKRCIERKAALLTVQIAASPFGEAKDSPGYSQQAVRRFAGPVLIGAALRFHQDVACASGPGSNLTGQPGTARGSL